MSTGDGRIGCAQPVHLVTLLDAPHHTSGITTLVAACLYTKKGRTWPFWPLSTILGHTQR